jgi:hypothetical protein
MQENPIEYAQKITDLLANVTFASADAALKIARTLLDYRPTCASLEEATVRSPQADSEA